MKYGSSPLITNGSMSASFFSFGIDLQQEWIYSIQANWFSTSSASQSGLGTMKLQISNDNVVPGTASTNPSVNVTNWCDYTGSLSSTSLSTGTSTFVWNVLYPGYRWVRMAYTAASGTGVMNVNFFGKGN